MRKVTAIHLIVLQVSLFACASKRFSPAWPAKGFLVYASRELYPDYGQPRGGEGTVDFLTGKTERNPVISGVGSNAPTLSLPACEPAEVRAVHRTSLRVRWLRDSQNSSTLGEDWSSVVHRSKDECLERIRTLKGGL